ncbi:sickle tail protein homolog isoform X1 [Ctenopharyngodon idella]|uniref:sickle tail protein homolog isoform X1 n=1 Tax=Ctenopharyngodon idella TaxID=7959 RepID=UPI00222E3303|nr:sickle tail protein homolog isoform X1 [Ctenopharyngodon idella]
MSKPSRLVKPSKQSRKEPPGNRSHMLVVGERLMRAGSEGNLVRSRPPQKPSATDPVGSNPEPARSNQRLCSHEDVDGHNRKQSSADESEQSDPRSPRTVPRRHTVGGPRTAGDVIIMQSYNMDHKKEAFLEHLKQKYPHHASVIMGHQERLRDQIRSSGHSVPPQSAVGEPGEHLSLASLESLEAMSEAEAPSAFTRGSRSRASLPVVKSTNQTKDRSLGFLYLQYGEDTKQIRMPNEVTSADTIRALFVSAFPQHLTMKTLESPSVAIYIKDDIRNMYYELTDVRNITSQSCLKVYHKDPAQAFNHNARANNGDIRITRERLYSSRQQPGGQSPVHTLPHSPIHSVQGSMSPPTPRSMPSSPSRIPFGHSVSMPGGTTLPRDRLSSVPPSRSITPCPSAILERRDVKPDEDLSSKSIPMYSEAYSSPEARHSLASSQGSHSGDIPDGAAYIQHRSSVKSVGAYPDGQDLQHSLYRQKSRKYSESQLGSMGSKTPPASPHRVNEVRMIDMLPGQNSHMPSQGVAVERASSVRRSMRKDSNGAMEVATRVRGNVASPVFAELPPSHGERPFQGHVAAGDPQSERIKAMEQQIASLTGLVQHALMKGPSTSAKETSSDKPVKVDSLAQNDSVYTVTSSKDPAVQIDSPSAQVHPPGRDPAICSILSTFRRNVSDLRLQLHQLKQMQLQNQDAMRLMLRQVEQEISEKVSGTVLPLEDPVHRQRVQVEEERHRYLGMEEHVLVQLGELENYVEMLKKESTSAMSLRPVTLKDVEEGAVNLRKVGEALATLKGEFPDLQMKMRAVLRVEVEAVRFLKEEPHKMDSMLKRVKALTDTLSGLRRYATESHNHTSDSVQVKALPTDSVSFVEEYRSPKPVCESPTPQPRSPAKVNCSEPVPSSPVTVHRIQTAPISTHHPSPPLTPTHGRDSPTVAKVSPRSRENSPALQKRAAPQGQEAVLVTTGSSSPPLQAEEIAVNKSRPMPEEVSKRAVTEDTVHSAGPEAEKEMERILQQTQASLMKAIPDLEVSSEVDSALSQTPILPDEVDSPLPVSPLPEASPQDGPIVDKPVQTSLERPQKPTIGKPHRASVDRVKPNPEMTSKSPPPPPPRRFYPSGTGLTTGRSGEVIYTTRKESISAQEDEEEAPQPKPLRVPPEVKPKPRTPPVNTSTLQDEEDEGDKIMAELQVFQKCTIKDLQPRYIVDLTTRESSDSEMKPGLSLSYHTKQTTTHLSEEGALSESRENSASPVSPGVMYYITGTSKTSNEGIYRPDDLKEPKEATFSTSKVAPVNASDLSQQQKLLISDDFSVISLESKQSVKEVQSKLNDIHQVSSGISLKNSPEVGKELKTESVLKSLKQVVPPPSEKVSPVEKLEQQILCTSSEQPVLDKSIKHGCRSTTVQVTLVSKSPQSAEPHNHSSIHQPNTDASCSAQLNDHENGQEVTKRSSRGPVRYTEEASLSPDLPGEEGPPPPNNIAFRITKNKVQALSTGEYQQLVNSKGTDVQTLKVGSEPTVPAPEDSGYDKKPVIIIFDEPMDICQAYKRLSTIFECEEELERVLSEERIDEENEEEAEVEANSSQLGQITPTNNALDQCRTENRVNSQRSGSAALPLQQQSSFESSALDVEEGDKTESPKDAKKKFKFKFPKKQLVAIGQALRTGTKTGKKTLQVVVYEDEEEPDGTVTELKEAKRFEIKAHADSDSNTLRSLSQNQTGTSQSTKDRTKELRKTTYETLDSLEQTIKQLESTISGIGPTVVSEVSCMEESKAKRIASHAEPEEGSPTKKPAPLKPKPHKSSLQKRPKTQSRSSSSTSTSSSSSNSKQNSGDSPASSRISSPKSRQQPGSVEKPGKPQKLQDSQRQFRQVVLL